MPTLEKTTAHELLLELKSFVKVEDKEIQAAERSGIDSKNSRDMGILLRGWANGKYDNDPFALVHEINTLVKKGKNGKLR
jgi:hypothetical protein